MDHRLDLLGSENSKVLGSEDHRQSDLRDHWLLLSQGNCSLWGCEDCNLLSGHVDNGSHDSGDHLDQR